MPQLTVLAGGRTFTAALEDNAAARALLERLPMTVTMEELNGNEKYHYLESPLPADDVRPGQIRSGDLMLYGGDCLVLFYEDFASSYRYTPLGALEDPAGLAAVLGRGAVEVTFQAAR